MKKLFFITPIGSTVSQERKRSDNIQKFLLTKAFAEHYEIIRADQLEDPGSITQQVIKLLIDSDLVVADVTGHNANVFYELGVRHSANKPLIQICSENEKLPFDIQDQRTIFYDLSDIQQHAEIIERLRKAEKNSVHYVSPVAEAGLRFDERQSDMLDVIQNILGKVEDIESEVTFNSLDDDISHAKDEILKHIDSIKGYHSDSDAYLLSRELMILNDKVTEIMRKLNSQ